MPGAYSSFDTLSLEWGEASPLGAGVQAAELPVLARIPTVSLPESHPAAGTAGHRQVEPAHESAPAPKSSIESLSASVFEVRSDSAKAIALAGVAATEEVEPSPILSPRLPEPNPPQPESQPSPPATTPATFESTADSPEAEIGETEGIVGALLRIESAIAPYSQMIVLVTLLAAAGLTLVLLRGEPAGIESPPIPAAPLQPDGSTFTATPPAPATEAIVAKSPTAGSNAQGHRRTSTHANGPVGVKPLTTPSGVASAATLVETHREPSTAGPSAPKLAQKPLTRPAGASPSPTETGPPVARLSRSILPHEETRK